MEEEQPLQSLEEGLDITSGMATSNKRQGWHMRCLGFPRLTGYMATLDDKQDWRKRAESQVPCCPCLPGCTWVACLILMLLLPTTNVFFYRYGTSYGVSAYGFDDIGLFDQISPPNEETANNRKQKAWDCPCPFLKTAYVQGMFEPDANGYVRMGDVYRVMRWAGVGMRAFPRRPYYQKFGVSGLPLMHLARNRNTDTGIMHAGISEKERQKRLKTFLSFAKDGKFGPPEFEAAIDYNCKSSKCNDFYLRNTRGELATMLSVFGHQQGFNWLNNFMYVDDIEALWIRNEWPSGWLQERRHPVGYGLTGTDIRMGFRFFLMRHHQLSDITVSVPPQAIAPWGDAPIQVGDEAEVTQKLMAATLGGKFSDPWDSRMGGVQNVTDGYEWEVEVWNKEPSRWQMSEEQMASFESR